MYRSLKVARARLLDDAPNKAQTPGCVHGGKGREKGRHGRRVTGEFDGAPPENDRHVGRQHRSPPRARETDKERWDGELAPRERARVFADRTGAVVAVAVELAGERSQPVTSEVVGLDRRVEV